MRSVTSKFKNNVGTLRVMWYVLAGSCVVQLIVASAAAAANAQTANGYKSASFAAVWTLFLVLLFQVMSAYIVFKQKSSALFVGFVIGTGLMTSELFFMLMCVFFLIGTEAQTINPGAAVDSDKAYGSFAFFNMFFYLIWSVILLQNRGDVIISEHGQDDDVVKDEDGPVEDSESYNPNSASNPYDNEDTNAL